MLPAAPAPCNPELRFCRKSIGHEVLHKPAAALNERMSLDHPDGIARLRYIVHRLRAPDGCPWDREQTHETLIPHLLEEAYEAAEAIRSGDTTHICEELGDLLLQPVLHAEIASETGAFDLDQMAHMLSEKLVRRHPHVFGETTADTSAAVLNQWDAIKKQEKGQTDAVGLLEGIGGGLPALMRAQKIQKKAARVGFDWAELPPVIGKIREELAEVEEALATGNAKAIEEELGDLLFSVVNLARKCGVESESALSATNDKFVSRFHDMEKRLTEDGHTLGSTSLEVMDRAWDAAKLAAAR